MKIILGILGDVKGYKPVLYEFDDKTQYTTRFITEALRQKYKNESKTLLFVPENLLEKNYHGKIDELKKKMNEDGENIEFENIEFIVLPSDSWAKFQDFVTKIFCGLIEFTKKIRKEIEIKNEEIYICGSIGQNIYVMALLEAVRKYLTYKQLENILQDPNIIEAKILSHPPITQDRNIAGGAYLCEMYDFKAKAFLSLPKVGNPNELYENSKKNEFRILLNQDDQLKNKISEFKENIDNCLQSLKIGYNSLRYNISLSFYTPQIMDLSMDLNEIENSLLYILDQLIIKNINVDSIKISNIFFSIAMLKSIKKFKENLGKPTIKNIKEQFTNVYTKDWLGLMLNKYVLDYELRNISREAEKNNVHDKTNLVKLFDTKGSEDQKRNFFAHCGFIKEFTWISRKDHQKRNFFAHCGFIKEFTWISRKDQDDYLIEWDEKNCNEIKKWIKNP